MLYNYNEAINLFQNDYKLNKAISDKLIYKVEKGIYSDGEKNYTEIEVLLKKYKGAFLVKDSALYHIGYLEKRPEKIHLGTARNAVRIKDERVKQHFYSNFDEIEIDCTWGKINHILNGSNVHRYYSDNGNEIRLFKFKALIYDLIRDRKKYLPNEFTALLSKFESWPVYSDFDLLEVEENLFFEGVEYDEDLHRILNEIEYQMWDLKWKKEWSW